MDYMTHIVPGAVGLAVGVELVVVGELETAGPLTQYASPTSIFVPSSILGQGQMK